MAYKLKVTYGEEEIASRIFDDSTQITLNTSGKLATGNITIQCEKELSRIGGRIFYDDGGNGATYTFYDANKNVITNQTVTSLANAVYYKVSGTPTKDRWYVYDNTTHTTGGVPVTGGITYGWMGWDKNMRGAIGITTDGIGRGKTNTATALAFTSDWGNNDIWGYIKNCNNDNLNGCNDWFIMSQAEQDKLRASGLVNWYSSEYIWSSVERSDNYAYNWYHYGSNWNSNSKDDNYGAFAGRSF